MGYRYRSPEESLLYSQRAGSEFEGDIYKALLMSNDKIQNTINTDLDTYEGTDFLMKNGLRLDATLNFDNKKNMPYIFDTGIAAANGKNFLIGIRIGNKHVKTDENGNIITNPKTNKPIHIYENFPKPVVVIGLDMDAQEYRQYEARIISRMERTETLKDNDGNVIKNHKGEEIKKYPIMDTLIELAMDAYEDYTTMDEKTREELFNTPLQKNKKYKQDEYTNKYYKALNEFQDILLDDDKETAIDDYSYL